MLKVNSKDISRRPERELSTLDEAASKTAQEGAWVLIEKKGKDTE